MTTELIQKFTEFARKRIPLEDVRRIFFSIRPELASSPVRNSLLLESLRELETASLIQMPAPGSWERLGNPPLPKWIQLVREEAPEAREDYSAVPWVPELGFWPELKPTALSAAKAINAFLLRRRGAFRLVPIKERSLDIFGDEKRLDALCAAGTMFGGRLPLSAIGAFQVPLPLPYRKAEAPGRPVLVLENHNSFWSFGEWNQQAKRYSAVVYAAGKAFLSSGAALEQVLREVEGHDAQYLGDLDPTGIRIPLDFNGSAASSAVRVEPALEFYRWLLANGVRRVRVNSSEYPKSLGYEWLGPELGEVLTGLWADGHWIPQEALGLEALCTAFVPRDN
jgi:hypothetical protein